MSSLARSKSRKKHSKAAKKGDDDLLLVLGDFFVTLLWACVSSTFAEAAETLSEVSGVTEFALAVTVTCVAIMAMGPLCDMFGGALFNPVHNAAFICAGKGTVSLNAIRMVAQIGGALAGSYAAVAVTPDWLKDHFHKLPGGLREGVALEVGVAAEMLLGLVLNVVVLASADTKNKFLGYWSPIIATVALIVAGSYFTGPSMNPAMAYSWYHHYAGPSLNEHVLVYWLAPFAGAMLGGLLYRAVAGRPAGAPRAKLPVELKEAAAAGAKAE